MTAPYKCGHPREGNSIPTGRGYSRCALCDRARKIVRQSIRMQARINAGGRTIGERIARGLA
jgi:hypothetical protein